MAGRVTRTKGTSPGYARYNHTDDPMHTGTKSLVSGGSGQKSVAAPGYEMLGVSKGMPTAQKRNSAGL